VESPIKIGNLLKVGKSFVTAQKQSLHITLYIDPRVDDEFVVDLCELFRPRTTRSKVFVQILSGSAQDDSAQIARESHKTTARVMVVTHASHLAGLAPLPPATCVIVTDELRSVAAQLLGVSILEVLSPRSGALEEQIAAWFSMKLASRRLPLAGDYPFMRAAISHDICAATAWQNAVIALVPFTHGADMPVLVGNQTKMLFQLALAQGLKLNAQRIPELVVTGAAALGSRALAQRFLFRFPPARWLARGALAYVVTLGLGLAACEYYERRAASEQEHAAAALESGLAGSAGSARAALPEGSTAEA